MLLIEHQEKWSTDFEQIKQLLLNQLTTYAEIQIEHVGSTAVSGLIAKPIIDIDLIYFSESDFIPINEGLQEIGYYHNGNQGIEGREVFKRTSEENHPTLDSIKHHLYICYEGSDELKRHLLFRDKLRKDNELAKEYAELKLHLAARANQDRKVYAQLKETEARAFFDKILK